MATSIILGFQGCGKSHFCDNSTTKRCKDMDFKFYPHEEGWLSKYVDEIEDLISDGGYDYIFCNISPELMDALSKKSIPFKVITPLWHTNRGQDEDFLTLKQILFGRYVLRKEQTASNVWWIEKVKSHYDEWTNFSMFKKYSDMNIAEIIPMTAEKNSISKIL